MKKKTLIISLLSILAVVAVVMFIYNCIRIVAVFNNLQNIIDEFKNDSYYIYKINYYSAINNIISSFAYAFSGIALGWLSIYSMINYVKYGTVQNKAFVMLFIVIILAMMVVPNVSALIYQTKLYDGIILIIVSSGNNLLFALIYLALAVLGVVYLCRKKTPEEIETIKRRKQSKKEETIKKLQEKIEQLQKSIE